MALIVLALLLVVQACQSARSAWLLAAAAALGLAFDVKLLESLVALPGLAVLAYLGLPGSRRAAPGAARGGRGRVCRRRAGMAGSNPARSRPRTAICDRLDQRQRVERGIRVQRHRPAGRQIARTAADGVRTRPPLPGGDPVRARSHPDSPAVPHPPAGPHRPPLRRAPGARAAGRAAAGGARALLGRTASRTREPRRDARSAQAPPGARRAGCEADRRRWLADAARACGGTRRVGADGHRAVQLHDPASPALCRGTHPGGRGDARVRRGVGELGAGRGRLLR